jgi:hypothetical protein
MGVRPSPAFRRFHSREKRVSIVAVWRPDDDVLLERLEDEVVLEALFRHHVPKEDAPPPHPRAAGLVAAARAFPAGLAAVRAALSTCDPRASGVAELARVLEAEPFVTRPPALVHHLALYFAKVADSLARGSPEAAANAWTRSVAAWLALGEEKAYLADLVSVMAGTDPIRGGTNAPFPALAPEQVALDVIADLGRCAATSARELAPSGRAALLALGAIDVAVRLAGARDATARRASEAADRYRTAALDAALGVVSEALEGANARGELAPAALPLLQRVIAVWRWSGESEQAEQFAVDRLATSGWELYRARDWDALRALLAPFRPLIESLAVRIERDRSNIAYAAPCAQMFVFLSDVETSFAGRLAHAERAVALCPTHRNGRLILAALLCEQAHTAMRGMVLFARKDELERLDALLARAEALYPQSSELPDAKAMLARIKKGKIALG